MIHTMSTKARNRKKCQAKDIKIHGEERSYPVSGIRKAFMEKVIFDLSLIGWVEFLHVALTRTGTSRRRSKERNEITKVQNIFMGLWYGWNIGQV